MDIFTFELSLPLCDIQDAYAEFFEFCDKYDQELNWEPINEKYHTAKHVLGEMLSFEEELVSLDAKEHHKRVSIYLDYIEKCKSSLNEHMIQILYERMVAACCLNGKYCNETNSKFLNHRILIVVSSFCDCLQQQVG